MREESGKSEEWSEGGWGGGVGCGSAFSLIDLTRDTSLPPFTPIPYFPLPPSLPPLFHPPPLRSFERPLCDNAGLDGADADVGVGRERVFAFG